MDKDPLEITFAQVPIIILKSKTLTPLEKLIYSFLEYYQFKNEIINSNILSDALGIDRDSIRRHLNKLNKLFLEGDGVPADFISIKFIKQKFNQPDEIVIHFNYKSKPLTITTDKTTRAADLNYQETAILKHFLKSSKYFSSYKPDFLLTAARAADLNNLVKGIMYTDGKKQRIKKPEAYLYNCFDQDGKFKYEKCSQQLKAYVPKRRQNLSINSSVVYAISIPENKKLIEQISFKKEYKYFYINDENEIIIYYALWHGKKANIKNMLDNFNIKYTIYQRANYSAKIALKQIQHKLDDKENE